MIIEIGHFALVLALAVAVAQMVAPMLGAHRRDATLMNIAGPAALLQFALVLLAFAALTWAFLVSDFSLKLAYDNSQSAKPLIYKISGVWGNHEGSMVLWVLILALFGAMVALFGDNLPATLRARVLSVQASIAVAFLLFVAYLQSVRRLDLRLRRHRAQPAAPGPRAAFIRPGSRGLCRYSMTFFCRRGVAEGRVDAAGRWVCLALAGLSLTIGTRWPVVAITRSAGAHLFWDLVENAC